MSKTQQEIQEFLDLLRSVGMFLVWNNPNTRRLEEIKRLPEELFLDICSGRPIAAKDLCLAGRYARFLSVKLHPGKKWEDLSFEIRSYLWGIALQDVKERRNRKG